MPPCPGLKLGSSAARWAGRVRAPAAGRLARGPAGRARRVRARRARAGGAGGSPCGPLYHSGRTFVSPARWAARNARRRASMNESSPAGQRVSGGEARGSPPPSAGPRRRLLPTRAAVSVHLFDRSFTPEMDDTEQRASSHLQRDLEDDCSRREQQSRCTSLTGRSLPRWTTRSSAQAAGPPVAVASHAPGKMPERGSAVC